MHLLRNINHCVALLFALMIPARLTSAQTCADDSAFRFVTKNTGVTVNCAWLNKNKNHSAKRISMYCGDPSIKDACPAGCGDCGGAITCEDTNGFMFELNFSGKNVGCNWLLGKNTARRTGRYCVESGSFFDAEIADGCVASCGLCEDDAPTASTAPASTPVSTPERTPAPTKGPTAATICPYGKSPFTITLMNMGNNTKFDAAFASAKAKWESIIKCNVDDYWKGFGDFDWFNGRFSEPFNGGVDGVVIGFSMEYIDGIDEEFNTLGSAGAVHVRGQGGSPLSGIMVFDEDDFASMSKNDAEIIILHEMGHILGLVNLNFSACFSSCGSGNFDYGGTSGCSLASDEYNALNLGVGNLKVENDGGGGTRCSHWEEDSFPKSTGSSELMTGFFESGSAQPITRVTIAALDEVTEDYVVDYNAANPYPFTNNVFLAREQGGSKVYTPDTTFTIRDRMVDLPPPILYVQGN